MKDTNKCYKHDIHTIIGGYETKRARPMKIFITDCISLGMCSQVVN